MRFIRSTSAPISQEEKRNDEKNPVVAPPNFNFLWFDNHNDITFDRFDIHVFTLQQEYL